MNKKIIALLLFFAPAAVLAQDGQYILKGTLGNYGHSAKVYLEYKSKNSFFLDSSSIVNGAFRFEGKRAEDRKGRE